MIKKDFLNIIPDQYTGKEIEAEAFIELKNEKDAAIFYETAKERLLNVNKWHKVTGIISAGFQAIDKNGNEAERPVVKGDYMRVDIPGPGNKEGDGYDWVLIEELKEVSDDDTQSIGFRVRPVANPLNAKKGIAHFYNESATSSFIITREGKKITANIIDRNIKANSDTTSLTDKIRDTAIGMSAIAGFSKLQWQNLAEGLVKMEN